jgi:hypothetical protein
MHCFGNRRQAEAAKRCKAVAADDFDRILLEVTEEACSGLSETGRKVVYSHLRKQYGLNR